MDYLTDKISNSLVLGRSHLGVLIFIFLVTPRGLVFGPFATAEKGTLIPEPGLTVSFLFFLQSKIKFEIDRKSYI